MTADSTPTDGPDHDVVVVGGGPAGCSTAVFTARYGLDTVVFDRGASSLARCAHLENYLGFPAGIDVETFTDLAHTHAETSGATIVADTVETTTQDGDGFRVETADGRVVTTRFVVAAAKYDAEYLRGLDDTAMFTTIQHHGEPTEQFDREYANADGSTPVEGLYVAGPLAGCGDQAITAAGHGATVGRAIVERLRTEAGYWGMYAERYDWLRPPSEYAGEWAERDRWREMFDDDAPEELDEETRERLRERYVEESFETFLDPEEVETRRARGYRVLADHLDETAMLDAIDDETIREYAAALSPAAAPSDGD